MTDLFNLQLAWDEPDMKDLDRESFTEKLLAEVEKAYQRQEEDNGVDQMRQMIQVSPTFLSWMKITRS